MTYQEKYTELRNEFSLKGRAFEEADKKLTSEPDGFINKKAIEDFLRAHKDWQDAGKKYAEFWLYCKQNQINANDEMPLAMVFDA